MSNQSENERYLSEAGKGSMEDKFYENSRTDSGFLSGHITSEEIRSEEITSATESGLIEEDIKEDNLMRLDSGVVCLSQTFSSLSLDLKTPGLNNLNTTKTRTNENVDSKIIEEKHPWELYYKQDEDGDT